MEYMEKRKRTIRKFLMVWENERFFYLLGLVEQTLHRFFLFIGCIMMKYISEHEAIFFLTVSNMVSSFYTLRGMYPVKLLTKILSFLANFWIRIFSYSLWWWAHHSSLLLTLNGIMIQIWWSLLPILVAV